MIGRRQRAVAERSLALIGVASAFYACSAASRPSQSGVEPPFDAGVRDSGAPVEASADSGKPDSGSPADAGQDARTDGMAEGGDAGVAPDSGEDSSFAGPPPPAALCSTSGTWGTGVVLSISTSADDELDGITPDELSLVWSEGTGSAATLQVADRTATTDPFGAPQAIPAGAFGTDRAAISQDGLRLVVVNADGQGFSELTRTSRTAPGNTFGAPSQGTYTNLDMAGALASGESYGDPVLSADDHAFYYSIYGGSLTATIFRTERIFGGDSWPAGAALTASSSLTAEGSLRRQPTAISSDEQTLFFYDQVMGTERAAFINESTGAFDVFVDLGARVMAAPNAACTTLYYSSPGASSVDLFSAPD